MKKYSDPKLQSLLAAEYVLGSLYGAARRRFTALLTHEPGLRQELEYWQRRLNPLAEALPLQRPRRRVWKNIQRRIQGGTVRRGWLSPLWNSLALWRGLATGSMAALLLSVLAALQLNQDYQAAIHYVAVLKNEQAQPMLIATMDAGNMFTIDMLGPDNTGPDEVMEIWCLPRAGGKPVSMGLLKGQRFRMPLSREKLQQLETAGEIAISIEPAGGSPTGLPTGPVMYRGETI
jgi:anti-sigma-K factor RskA